jgi:hypothetical protein
MFGEGALRIADDKDASFGDKGLDVGNYSADRT